MVNKAVKKLGLHISKKAREAMLELQQKHEGDSKKIMEDIRKYEIPEEDLSAIEEMCKEGIGINTLESLTLEEKIDAILWMLEKIWEQLK